MNKQKLIKQMTAVVKDVMTANQSDFYEFDTKAIEGMEDSHLPIIWACGPLSTYMFFPLKEAESFTPKHESYWDYLRDRTLPLMFLVDGVTLENHKFFLILPKGLQKIERSQIKEVMRDTMAPAIESLKAEFGGSVPSFQVAWDKYHR